mmetsp:Transcript_14066/g.26333  ORF Transcript_14066/g.26333 Transcript_14066/m.26333 type:complete len:218 (-) Transcript_14066:1120-1773(-)
MGCICSNTSTRSETKGKSVLRKDGNFTYSLYEDTFVGDGCRKALAWSTTFTPQQVQFKIEEFWESRRQGNPDAWRTLRLAIENANQEEAKVIVTTAGLTMPTGLLSGAVDDLGFVYEIPPYVLNPAMEYGAAAETFSTGKGELVEIKLRSTQFGDFDLKTHTSETVLSVKQKTAEKFALIPSQVRTFYNGREMKNDFMLLQYGVKDKTTMTVVTLPR